MKFPVIPEHIRVRMLEHPSGSPVEMVLDTDAYTEVDDPFAIAYALASPERLRVEAVYAAPFAMNERTQDPAEGMELSFREIHNVMELMGRKGTLSVCRGSAGYLGEGKQPLESEAARDLIRRAEGRSPDNPLYVAAIGVVTNVASAILLQPEIIRNLVVVWLGGDDFFYTPNQYNVYQDVAAAQVLFDCGVPLVYIPCNYVASHLITSMPELRETIGGANRLCDYLVGIVGEYGKDHFAWGKQIWDLAVIGYLMNESWTTSALTPAPIITGQLTYSFDGGRHLMRIVKSLSRDSIFRDCLDKLRRIRA